MKNFLLAIIIILFVCAVGYFTLKQYKKLNQPDNAVKISPASEQLNNPVHNPVTPVSTFSPTKSSDSKVITLIYQPKQCDTTPWDAWYQSGATKYVKKPTDEELIAAYYSSQSIPVANVVKRETGAVVCQTCHVCSTTYVYELQTASDMSDKLTLVGWARRGEGDSPAPQSNDEQYIKEAFAAKYNKAVKDISLSIGRFDGTHASGTFRFEGEPDGGYFYAAKANGGWIIVFSGQGAMFCTDAEKFQFPKEFVSECIEQKTGETIFR